MKHISDGSNGWGGAAAATDDGDLDGHDGLKC